PHSWKVSSRGGVAAGVSGGREDGAAGGTGQGSRLVPVRGADWYRSGEQTGTGQGSRLVPVRGADWYRSGEQTGTGQGSRLVLAGRRSASCRVRRRMGRSATLKTPRLAWGT